MKPTGVSPPSSGPGDASPLDIFNRLTKGEFIAAWRGLKTMARQALGRQEGDMGRFEDREALRGLIAECISARGGDVSARLRAVELGTVYLHLSDEGRRRFLDILARDFDTNREKIVEKAEALGDAEGPEAAVKAEIALREALEPPRLRLLRQFSSLPNGFKFLVDLRAELLPEARNDPAFYKLSLDLKELLASWFDVSLLDLQEITWNSPAAVLEKLIEYEAVHEIRSWGELRARLDSDRLCFGFFHPKMPSEPLIFVEVALMEGLSDNIQDLLKESGALPPERATTAIFYSISNTQAGLAGISLGNFLIKTVVERLSRERPHLRRFATLSPVPGFRDWLEPTLGRDGGAVLLPEEQEAILRRYPEADPLVQLRTILSEDWAAGAETAELARPVLMRLCARYLLQEKRGIKARDPVANFHLTNGARLERINWLADTSGSGMARSFGIMVNYDYRPGEIEDNHEAYVASGTIAASRSVRSLLRE